MEFSILEPTDTAPVSGASYPTSGEITNKTTVVTANMDEVEFMNYTLEQLRQGHGQGAIHLAEEALAGFEAESIGEDFARRPFLY